MKKVLLTVSILIVTLFPVLALSGSAGAVDLFGACNTPTVTGAKPTVCTDVNNQKTAGTNPVTHLLKIALDILALIAGVSAILLIIINSLRLVVSSGDSNSVSSARTGLLYALIGVVIVLIAQTIVVFVLDRVQ